MAQIPWVEKYRPKRLSEFIGNRNAVLDFISWLKSWEKGEPKQKALLLYGPPGVGKTTLVHVVARELGYELIELNASDVRRASEIKRIIARTIELGSLYGSKGRIVLFDEIDGMSGTEDRGGLAEIVEVIKNTRIPIVLTANDPWDPKFRNLRELCKLVRLQRLNTRQVIMLLKRICDAEGIKADPAALRLIAELSQGDLRSAINDLQAVAQGRRVITVEDVKGLGRRIREYDVFTVLKMLFSAKRAEQAKAVLSQSMVDYDLLLEWIHENLPYQYRDPEELAEAYDALSKADVYFGRIIRTQNWGLLSYALDLMTAGVAMARKHPYHFVKYRFPQRLLLLSKTKEVRQLRERICERIARRLHVSKKYANAEMIPILKVIFLNNPKMGAGIAKWLDLSEEMIEFIVGDKGKAKEIVTIMRQKEAKEKRTQRRKPTTPPSPLFM